MFVLKFSARHKIPVKVFSLSAILNGNKWLLCPLDGENSMCFFLMRCTSNVPRARRGGAPAGTATGISPSYGCSAAGLDPRRESRAGRHGAGVGAAWSRKAMTGSIPGSRTRERLWRHSGSRGRGQLLLGQQRAPVGLHLLQPLHQVPVAHLQLLRFIQRWAQLKEGRKAEKHRNFHPFPRQSKICSYQHWLTILTWNIEQLKIPLEELNCFAGHTHRCFSTLPRTQGIYRMLNKEGQVKKKCGLPSLDLAWQNRVLRQSAWAEGYSCGTGDSQGITEFPSVQRHEALGDVHLSHCSAFLFLVPRTLSTAVSQSLSFL